MFGHHIPESYYFPTPEEIAEEQKRYSELKAAIEFDVSEEKTKLERWLQNKDNRVKVHYGIVEDIFNHFHRKTKNNDDLWLDHYRNIRDDLCAVNGAINGRGTAALRERAEAAKESYSPGLEVTGILLTVLAVTLICASVIMLNPLIAYLGAIAAVSAFAAYQIGSAKVSNERSTLFSRLSDKISPPSLYHDDAGPVMFSEADMAGGFYFPPNW